MASRTKTRIRALLVAVLSPGMAMGQAMLTLEQVSERKKPDFAPVYEGEVVAVRGTVSARPVEMMYYTHVPIQDQTYGLVLEGMPSQFSGLQPGDRIEVYGTISKRAGLPVLLPAELQTLSRGSPPSPQWVGIEELDSFRYVGVLIATEARVLDAGENTGGEYMVLGTREKNLKVFLPLSARGPEPRLTKFQVGDKVRVVGFASQYCPSPPYNRFFQIVVTDPNGVTLVSKRWLIQPELFLAALVALFFFLALWWVRGRRVTAQRRILKTLYSLGEEILGASSASEILNQILTVLPAVLGVSGIRMYLYNRATKKLDQVESSADPKLVSIPVDCPGGLIPSGAAACFRNQTLLTIPDTRRSPFLRDKAEDEEIRSVMFVPMLAQSELRGVLEIHDTSRSHNFSMDEQVLAQHLANQIAISLRLMEEQSIRDQLTRSEKLAAAGQLLSGVATELRAPLEMISRLAESLLFRRRGAVSEDDLHAIAGEAEKASAIVNRLVSFSQSEPAEAKPVDLAALLRSLMDFRRQEWKARGFEVQDLVGREPVCVLGSRGQLERVFLNLLVHAEQSLAETPEKKLSIGISALAKRAQVEISYSAGSAKGPRMAGPDEASETGVLIEGVVRGIVQTHGGETRLLRIPGAGSRMEVELPLAPEKPGAPLSAPDASRFSTVLLVEADAGAQQQLLAALGKRGYRVVPAQSAEQGVDLVQRLRFDLIFCAISLPGLNWLEFFESVRHQTSAFVLLAEGFDPELLRGFPYSDLHVLAKPITESELERLLCSLESGVEPGPVKPA